MTLFHTSRQFFSTRDSNRVAKAIYRVKWSELKNGHQKRVVNQELFEQKWVRK